MGTRYTNPLPINFRKVWFDVLKFVIAIGQGILNCGFWIADFGLAERHRLSHGIFLGQKGGDGVQDCLDILVNLFLRHLFGD